MQARRPFAKQRGFVLLRLLKGCCYRRDLARLCVHAQRCHLPRMSLVLKHACVDFGERRREGGTERERPFTRN